MMKLIRILILAWIASANMNHLFADDGRYLKYQRVLLIDNDTIKCRQLLSYAKNIRDSLHDYNFALLIYDNVNEILKRKNYPYFNFKLYCGWAYTYYLNGNYEQADKYYTKALGLNWLRDEPAEKAVALNMAAINIQYLMVFERALLYYHEALEIYTRLNDEKGRGTVYWNMANLFASTGNLAYADQLMNKGAKIFQQNNMLDDYGLLLANKANITAKSGNIKGAKVLLIHSLEVDLKKIKRPQSFVERYANLGSAYAELKNWDSSFYCLNRAKSLSDSLGSWSYFAGSYYNCMGYAYDLKADINKALYYYKQAVGVKNGISHYRYLYGNIADLYIKNKKYDSAFLYKDKALHIADSVYKSELKEHMIFENKRVELLEKDFENQIRYANQQQSLNNLERRNYRLISAVIVLLVVVLLLFLYFRQYRLKIKKEHLQSELDFLRAQLNPHFLFNSINNIYVLLDENKTRARETLLKFSELMRYQLYECNVSRIELKKELHFLENYIEFEKLRYSNKITVNYAIDDSAAGKLQIAPLLLQPFIENAFKHTPKTKNGQSHIEIKGSVSGNTLSFYVSNTANTTDTSSLPGGIGLENVKKRLKLLYSKKHELTIAHSGNLYKIILSLVLEND